MTGTCNEKLTSEQQTSRKGKDESTYNSEQTSEVEVSKRRERKGAEKYFKLYESNSFHCAIL